ncbi:MAG: hypothetical protein K2X06_00670 [Burkholderiales bacterium]|nr:hypothetical protein [Burkholderiales bacterium]
MDPLAQQALTALENAFRELEKQVPPPKIIRVDGQPKIRYKEQLIEQALIQKLARYISSLEATYLLLQHGFLQEQGVLQRTLDELSEDIMFLAIAITNDFPTDLHKRYLAAFWSELFADDTAPVESLIDNDMVQRKKIRAYISRILGPNTNPSRDLATSKTISKIYSGYVHAASPHLMELCVGNPLKFHVRGMLGTPRVKDHHFDIWNYFYRGLVNASVVAKALGDAELLKVILEYSFKFQQQCGRDFGVKKPKS